MGTGQDPPVLEVVEVLKRWPGEPRPVLADVTLRAGCGSATLISGVNGAGKTTLLRIIAGMVTPDAGRVTIAGHEHDADRAAYQQEVGLTSAGDSGLWNRLDVRQHLGLWLRLAFVAPRERPAALAHTLEAFELQALAKRRVDRLSMGQRQRLRLALAFCHTPRLVLLDEPLNSLDEPGAAVVARAVEAVRARGGAVLWCAPGRAGAPVDFDAEHTLAAGSLTAR